METAMKKGHLYQLKEVIGQLKKLGSNDFKYRLVLLEMEVDKHTKILDDIRDSEGLEKLKQERQQVIFEYADKDKEGNVILYKDAECTEKSTTGSGYPKIKESKKKALEKALEAFLKQNEQQLKKFEQKEKEWVASLEDDCVDFNFKPIPRDIFPEMEYEQMQVLVICNIFEQDEDA